MLQVQGHTLEDTPGNAFAHGLNEENCGEMKSTGAQNEGARDPSPPAVFHVLRLRMRKPGTPLPPAVFHVLSP